MKNVLGIVLLVFASKLKTATGSCTEADISACARPLAAFKLADSPIVPTWTKQKMTELCEAYNKVKTCLKGIEAGCNHSQRRKMKTIDNQYGYICDQTLEEYLRHRQCLATPDLHTDANKCNATLTNHIQDTFASNKSAGYKRDRLCQYVYQYLGCIHVSVRAFCGEEAADWQKGLDDVTVQPAFSNLSCPVFNQKSGSTWSPPLAISDGPGTTMIIVAVIVVGVACLVLVGGMTAFFIHRKRRADNKRAAHEMMNVPREPRRRNTRTSQSYEQEVSTEGAHAASPSGDFLAPPPYLDKDVPPPSYRNPPNYTALFQPTATAGAEGTTHTDNFANPKS